MTQDSDPPMTDAAQMFQTQRAELSLLRRAIERLTDERAEQPDYTPSFEALIQRIAKVEQWAEEIAERPGIKLTPQGMTTEINRAAGTSREQDRDMLHDAATRMTHQTHAIAAIIGMARTKDDQAREIIFYSILSATLGILLWATLPGMVARSLPESWAVPERLAARTLRTDIWDGGARMMGTAGPERWKQITDLVTREDERLAAEKNAAEKEDVEKAKAKPNGKRGKK